VGQKIIKVPYFPKIKEVSPKNFYEKISTRLAPLGRSPCGRRKYFGSPFQILKKKY